jgi:hypothetical protein
MLMTDWGDSGHRQQLPVSMPGFALAAALSWCDRANRNIDLASALDRHAFAATAAGAGKLWLDAGRVHELSGLTIHNRSVFFELMNRPLERIGDVKGLTIGRVERMERETRDLARRAKRVDLGGELVREELALTLRILEHACRRGRLALSRPVGGRSKVRARTMTDDAVEIMSRHRTLWLARSRRGGLGRCLSHYRGNLREYKSL